MECKHWETVAVVDKGDVGWGDVGRAVEGAGLEVHNSELAEACGRVKQAGKHGSIEGAMMYSMVKGRRNFW